MSALERVFGVVGSAQAQAVLQMQSVNAHLGEQHRAASLKQMFEALSEKDKLAEEVSEITKSQVKAVRCAECAKLYRNVHAAHCACISAACTQR